MYGDYSPTCIKAPCSQIKLDFVSAKKNSRFSAENIDWMRHISIILNKYLHVVFKALSNAKSIFKTSTIATGVRELWK